MNVKIGDLLLYPDNIKFSDFWLVLSINEGNFLSTVLWSLKGQRLVKLDKKWVETHFELRARVEE